MATTAAQQIALDNALVALEKQVEIGKCNMRIDPDKTWKEPTYRVVLDTLTITTCCPAFLITVSVLVIYMQQFWATINKHEVSYQLKIGKKSFSIDVKVFREILQIYPRLSNKKFDEPPTEEEILSFIKDIGHTGNIKNITTVVVDHMHQPWRTFVAIINKCLSGKTTDLDKIHNRDIKEQEKMFYLRFTKAIIHHFLSKDKSISMRNRMFMHTAEDDNILEIRESAAYQTYLAYATGAATLKPKRIYKKQVSPIIKTTTISPEETPSKKKSTPAKKDVSLKKPSSKQSFGVQIKDTPGVSVSKKTPTTTERSKGIDLLSEAALLEAAQMKKALKRSKMETHSHDASSLGDGVGSQLKVLDEPKGKKTVTSEGTGDSGDEDDSNNDDVSDDEDNDDNSDDDGDKDASDEEKTESDDNQNDDNKEEEYVHTPENYESTDDEDEHVDEEEYKELYRYVNVNLKDAEHREEGKGDVEMTDTGHEDATQEKSYKKVEDYAHVTLTIAHVAQKTEGLMKSSSVSSDFASQFLNLDNTPPADHEIISMMNVEARHEEPSTQTPSLLIVPVTVIHETSTAATTIIPSIIPPFTPTP
ncbi:hypothetical protein Tco_0474220 [Tanacetum coccineum]